MKKLKLIALFSALIVGFGLYRFLQEAGKPQEVPHTMVVVAAVDIPENKTITEEMVTLRSVATESLVGGNLKDLESVVGSALSSDVYAGEQITALRLERSEKSDTPSDTLAYIVDPGMRAVTVNVTPASGLTGLIKPGNRVDVVINYADEVTEGDETKKIPTSQLLIQNCEVLAVDSVLGKTGASEYSTVTLQVLPEEAVKLSYAEFTGNVRLLLRSPLDDETQKVIRIDSVSEKQGGSK